MNLCEISKKLNCLQPSLILDLNNSRINQVTNEINVSGVLDQRWMEAIYVHSQ